jgi:hypothetical protein
MLGSMPVEPALEICGLNFAARQGHRLENLLEAECRVLIRALSRTMLLVCIFPDCFFYLFRHNEDDF